MGIKVALKVLSNTWLIICILILMYIIHNNNNKKHVFLKLYKLSTIFKHHTIIKVSERFSLSPGDQKTKSSLFPSTWSRSCGQFHSVSGHLVRQVDSVIVGPGIRLLFLPVLMPGKVDKDLEEGREERRCQIKRQMKSRWLVLLTSSFLMARWLHRIWCSHRPAGTLYRKGIQFSRRPVYCMSL